MFIQSFVPNFISTALSFATDNGQLNMDSNCGETWQKSPQCDECRGSVSTGEEESKLSSTSIVELSSACSDFSAANCMCASSAANRDDSVYKRRKLHRDTVALPLEENVTERTRRNSGCHSIIGYLDEPFTVSNENIDRAPTLIGSNNTLDNGNPSISGWHHLQKPSNVPSSQSNDIRNLESVANTVPKRSSIREDEVPIESSVSILRKSVSEHNSGIKDSCSSSKSSNVQVSTLMKTELEDIGVCSSSDIIVAEPLGEFTSAKELCISVLKHHGLLGGLSTTGACASFEVLSVDDTNCSRSCKICGRLENPMKMLICDLCEEAFHVSCCNPRIEKLPVDEWYCQPCFRKKPKCVVKNGTTKSFSIGEHRKSRSDGDLGPIPFMLRDNQPYTTVVRIGKDFQAEVPEWSGPVYDDYDHFREPVVLDPAECAILNGWLYNKPSKPSSIGNWIQCREVTYKDANDEGTVCGKWRRAPLFVVQTDDWDCSCALLWDPVHADCAVPQELETHIVLRHLKYVEMLRSRMANDKQKSSQTQGDGPS